jgi:hypothetical protein
MVVDWANRRNQHHRNKNNPELHLEVYEWMCHRLELWVDVIYEIGRG